MDRRKGAPFPDNSIIPKLVLQTKEGGDPDIIKCSQLTELANPGPQPKI